MGVVYGVLGGVVVYGVLGSCGVVLMFLVAEELLVVSLLACLVAEELFMVCLVAVESF